MAVTLGPRATGRPTRRPVYVRGVEPREINDPGNAGRITAVGEGFVLLKTIQAETRTLTDPIYAGQVLDLIFETDIGDCVITADSAVNQTGNNTLTFADGGDHCRLYGGRDGAGDLEWRVVADGTEGNDGVALSTV